MSDFIHIREFVHPTHSLQILLQEWNLHGIKVYELKSGQYQLLTETSLTEWETAQRIQLEQIRQLKKSEYDLDVNSENKLGTDPFFVSTGPRALFCI